MDITGLSLILQHLVAAGVCLICINLLKYLFAMIRQLSFPIWFCSLSAADTKWHHLLSLLGRLLETTDYTNDQLDSMTEQKNQS